MRFLFINAPFGPFFSELLTALEAHGCRGFRIVRDGGEFISTPRRARVQMPRGTPWRGGVESAITRLEIDAVVSFSDSTPDARAGLEAARTLEVERYVLENGYLRPYWVTLARNGVNALADMPRDPAFYLAERAPRPPHQTFRSESRAHAWRAVVHYGAACLLARALPFTPQAFGVSLARHATFYAREWLWRKTNSPRAELKTVDQAAARGPLFLCLLQRPGDSQLRVHSPFGDNRVFITAVMNSFARASPPDTVLAIKQHPLDPGFERCHQHVHAEASRLSLMGRVIYLRQIDLEHPLSRASGVVTVNSSAGLAAVERGIPTICLGATFYDLSGITHQGVLDSFWSRLTRPDPDLTEAFLSHLARTSQFNGGFYGKEARALLTPALAAALAGDSLVRYGSATEGGTRAPSKSGPASLSPDARCNSPLAQGAHAIRP